MQIRRAIFIISIFSLLLNTFAVFAAEKSKTLEDKIYNFNQRVNLFHRNCINKDGSLNLIIEDPDGNQIDCSSEGKALQDVDRQLSLAVANDASIAADPTCHPLLDSTDGAVGKLSSEILKAADSVTCSKKEAQAEELSCVKEAGCNALRSIMTLSGVSGAKNALQSIIGKVSSDKESQNSCASSTKSDCITELVAGVLKDIWSNIEGAWDLLKMGGGWAKDKIISGWKHFTHTEDLTADAAHAASQQSEGMINTFIKSPSQALKKMGADIYNLIAKGIKDSFMCARWAGQPHLSKCLSPQTEPWECASCDEKINSICGVAGFAMGEIAVAYLTGGALRLGGEAVKGAKALMAGGKVAAKNGSKLSNATTKLSKLVKGKMAKMNRTKMSVIDKALKNKVASGAVGAVKVVSWPLTAYGKLMEKAFTLGLKHGDFVTSKMGSKVAKTAGSTAVAVEKTGHNIAEMKKTNVVSGEVGVQIKSTIADDPDKLRTFTQQEIAEARKIGGVTDAQVAASRAEAEVRSTRAASAEAGNKTGIEKGTRAPEDQRINIATKKTPEEIMAAMREAFSDSGSYAVSKNGSKSLDLSKGEVNLGIKAGTEVVGLKGEGAILIGDRLGTGGSGVVYEITRDGQKAAEVIKLPVDKMRASSLIDEIAAAKKLEDAGIPIAKITSADPKGSFIISEKISGPPTSKLIEKGLTNEQVASLADIYKKGKLNNFKLDLKPENLVWNESKKSFVVVDRGFSNATQSGLYNEGTWNSIFLKDTKDGAAKFKQLISEQQKTDIARTIDLAPVTENSQTALGSIRESVASGKNIRLSDSAKLDTEARIDAAQLVLKKELGKEQKEAITAAHEIGMSEGRGYFTYTKEDIAAKTRKLDEAGFSVTERRKLMESGITGTDAVGTLPREKHTLMGANQAIHDGAKKAKTFIEHQHYKLENAGFSKAERDAFIAGQNYGNDFTAAGKLKDALSNVKMANIIGESSRIEKERATLFKTINGFSDEEFKVNKEAISAAQKEVGRFTPAEIEKIKAESKKVIEPAKSHAGTIKEHSNIIIDGEQVAVGKELGRGSAGVVYSSGNNEVIKIPLDPRNVRDIHLEVQNAGKITDAGISGVPILNIPKDGTMPSYLRKPKLNNMENLDGEAIKHMNTGIYAGRYTPEQEKSLKDIYKKLQDYNKGKSEQAQLNLDLNPANLYWDQEKKQFLVIEGAPPTSGGQISKYWVGPNGREHFEDRYGISLSSQP